MTYTPYMQNSLPKNYNGIVEQIIRPTGLLDPIVEVRPSENQVQDLIIEIQRIIAKGQRVMVTTLTKRMSEDLSTFLKERDIKVQYIHSDIDAIQRVEILQDLRKGIYDVLIGINLLREGLDLPEVSFVAILDADKEGFLRSRTSLIQTIGRAARHSEGFVILYADKITDSMKFAIDETSRRRSIQEEYNKINNITPTSIIKEIKENAVLTRDKSNEDTKDKLDVALEKKAELYKSMKPKEKKEFMKELQFQMELFADQMQFEKAARVRDILKTLK